MKHEPNIKGSTKRERSRSPNKSPAEKRMKTVPDVEKKTDIYYNNTIEERFNKQAEQNHFLAKSLAGLSAEVRNLSSHQVPYPPLAPSQPPSLAQAPEAAWTPAALRSHPIVYGPPVRQSSAQDQPQQYFNQF